MQTVDSMTWTGALDALEIDWTAPILVAGMDAGALAGDFMRAGSAGIAAEGDDWFLLSSEHPAEAPESWHGLPHGVAGTVVLRKAWPDRPGLTTAVEMGAALVAPGGRLVVADIDSERLLEGSPVRYPYRFRFVLDPAAEASLREESMSTADLTLEVARAGMRGVVGVVIEEERGRYDGPAGYWTAVRDVAWPSLLEMPSYDREILLEDLAAGLSRVSPMGEIVERRPWFAATGARV